MINSLFKKNVCETCGTKFRKVEEMMQHKQLIHGKGLLYDCKNCNMSFEGMEQMRDHIKKFHSYNKIIEQRDIKKNSNNDK
jgi:KRAB domain-containing zinc finger protein